MNNSHNWILRDLIAISLIKGIKHSDIQTALGIYPNFKAMKLDDFSALKKFKNTQTDAFNTEQIDYLNLAEEQIEIANHRNESIISYFDASYPDLLKEILYPPLILYVAGQLAHSHSLSFSIVGTRKCSQYGKLTTARFSEFFANHNIIVTSGLAYGIDWEAHTATLKAGGVTYAVIASGLDLLSPSIAQKLALDIVNSNGAIISIFPYKTAAIQPYFLVRNRIISGISKAVIVVESATKGGSLWTARYAADQNRDVFAIPGNINSEKSKGTNKLIKDNLAIMALTPEDVINELALDIKSETKEQKELFFENALDEQIYKLLTHEPMQIDEIAESVGSSVSKILVSLLNLEFENLIRQLPGKHYIKESV